MRTLAGALVYMKKLALKLSLTFKIIGVVLLISLGFFPPLTYVNIEHSRKILEAAHVEKAKTIARLLDANIRNKAALSDESRLFAHIQKNIWLDPDIISIDIHLPVQGSLMTVVSSKSERVGKPADADNVDSYTQDMLINTIVEKGQQRYLRVVTPIHIAKQQAGTYQIDLTLEHVDRQIRTAIQVSVLSYVGMSLLFVLLLFWFLRVIMIRPVKEMNRGVETIAQGDLDWSVKITSHDELGELAAAFNQMTADLKASHRKLEDRRMALEQEVNERRAVEKKLQKAHDQLEERVKERTVELVEANEQLKWEVEERKEAEKKLKSTQVQLIQSGKLASIGELAAGVAHELNQPLMVIRTTGQLIQRSLDKGIGEVDALKEYFEPIGRNTRRMMNIINHLRVFSRQSQTDFSVVDVNKITADSFLMMGEQLRLRNIEVQKSLTPDIPKVRGDANQLEQVFLNLLTNARDAIEATGGKEPGQIEIVTRVSDNDNECVEILVKDSGTGIAADHLEKIFDPFFTSKEVGKGTGLGLSISYGIIQDHQGEIEVAATGPEGTTFRIRLPVLIED